MKYTVKFYPEKRTDKTTGKPIIKDVPLIMSIAYMGKRLFYYTRLRLNVGQWDVEKLRMRKNNIAPNGETASEFNNEITNIEAAVNKLFKQYDIDGIAPNTQTLRADLDASIKDKKIQDEVIEEILSKPVDLFEYFVEFIKLSQISEGRRKHYYTTLNKIKEFNPYTTLEMIKPDFLVRFRNYLIDSCGLGKNTYISEMKRLRAFINHCYKNCKIEANPFHQFKIDAESYGEPIYITIAERDKLFSSIITDERLARVRDMFILQCFIGCRVGDFVRLKRDNIIDGSIEYIAGKTKEDEPRIARIPLAPKALEIISRYNLPNGDLIPYISGQKYNTYLKELFKAVNIVRPVTILDPKTRLNVVVPICDIASSHMARRVFVGGLFGKAKDSVIASMSGHVENSRAFSRYYKIEKEDQQNAIKLIE